MPLAGPLLDCLFFLKNQGNLHKLSENLKGRMLLGRWRTVSQPCEYHIPQFYLRYIPYENKGDKRCLACLVCTWIECGQQVVPLLTNDDIGYDFETWIRPPLTFCMITFILRDHF